MSCGMTWRSPGRCYCKQETALESHETYLFFSILWCWFVEGSNHQAHTGICQDKWIALLFLVSLSLTQLLRP